MNTYEFSFALELHGSIWRYLREYARQYGMIYRLEPFCICFSTEDTKRTLSKSTWSLLFPYIQVPSGGRLQNYQ